MYKSYRTLLKGLIVDQFITLLQSTYGLNLIVPTLLVVLRLPNSKKNNATLHIKVPPITHPFEENNVVLDIKYLSF